MSPLFLEYCRGLVARVAQRYGRFMTPCIAVAALAACTHGIVGPAVDEQVVFQAPSAIVSDCSVDATTALHTWIASVPDSSELLFAKDGCYRIDAGLVIANRHGLTFNGNGATFRVFGLGWGSRANWTFRGGSKITLRNMIARGANPNAGTTAEAFNVSLQWQHGYRLRGVQGAVLDSVQAYDVFGDFVNLSFDDQVHYPGPPTRDVLIRRSRFERNGRMGISITHADGVLIEDNYIADVRWSAIDLELNNDLDLGRNIRVERNRFGSVYHAVFTNFGAGLSHSVANVVFSYNVMEANPLTCVPPVAVGTNKPSTFWTGYEIKNNVLRSYGRGVQLTRVKELNVGRNTLHFLRGGGCGHGDAVNITDSHRGMVTDNTMVDVPDTFVIVRVDSLSTGLTISNNIKQ